MNLVWGDWYLLISMSIGLILFWLLPRRFSDVTLVLIVLYTAFLTQTIDMVLAGHPLELYDFLQNEELGLTYALAQFLLYPEMAYLFLYFYTMWVKNWWRRIVYVAASVAGSVGYEWLTVQNGVLTYKGWKLIYSVPVYFLVFISLVLYYRFLQWLSGQKQT